MLVPDWAGYYEFRSRFAEVMDARYYPLDWLDQQVLHGKVQFWRTENAGCITEIRDYPSGATDIHALIGAGDLSEIIGEIFPRAEAWGREQGCIAAVVESREGWARMLRPLGYELYQTTVRKEI